MTKEYVEINKLVDQKIDQTYPIGSKRNPINVLLASPDLGVIK